MMAPRPDPDTSCRDESILSIKCQDRRRYRCPIALDDAPAIGKWPTDRDFVEPIRPNSFHLAGESSV